jgi:hypothetical protein
MRDNKLKNIVCACSNGISSVPRIKGVIQDIVHALHWCTTITTTTTALPTCFGLRKGRSIFNCHSLWILLYDTVFMYSQADKSGERVSSIAGDI